MSDERLACILKYLVKGVDPDREPRHQLRQELHDALPHASSIVVLPVVDGVSVEIEMLDLAPFNRSSFEPYVADHVLPDAVTTACRPHLDPQLQLLKSYFA